MFENIEYVTPVEFEDMKAMEDSTIRRSGIKKALDAYENGEVVDNIFEKVPSHMKEIADMYFEIVTTPDNQKEEGVESTIYGDFVVSECLIDVDALAHEYGK